MLRASRRSRRSRISAVLDDLGEPGGELALGQRRERVGVREHHARLVEGADHVLAERMVDRGLAADRGVDLREQRRRDLDERHAALIDGRGEAGEVADDAAAQRDDRACVRSQRCSSSASKIVFSVSQFLCASPSGSTIGTIATSCADSARVTARDRAARRSCS